MAIAAVPHYLLKQDLSQASPGLRFGMYLPFWGVDNRTGEHLWTTHDVNERSAGPQRELRAFKDENKAAALKQALRLNAADVDLMRALAQRQAALAAPMAAQGRLLALDARAVAPFTTGLGNEHPLENGFAFLNPYGLPYLAGSGVKGMLRQAARELASGDWGDTQGWDSRAIDTLFGWESANGETEHQRGALICWDVIPQITGDALQVEVMTPHQSHYYQDRRDARSGDSSSPHESGQPNPINFLTVPPGTGFAFHLQCDVPFLAAQHAELAQNGRWQALLQAALRHAFAWLGFGAKTAVGYGAMEEDQQAARARQQALESAQARAAAEDRVRRMAAMSPEDQAFEAAKVELAQFSQALDTAKKAGAFNPSGPFNQIRLAFMATALAWTEPRSRQAAAELLASSATKDWGRPSKKERWQELQQAIAQLRGQA
ncbi:type III-B CRISPR module RAMP protein Cmr6 [uncultured Azohydromonas sp.]|jgi:CRISPR type III-B/RAMP module RAMP protein Cmr6|uniref:type III-B CRISPR module RAMP protein Cmr6 n=1 Tax=uncultured Azohydromonas sp. TaxID=487342 RepID=UPI002637EC89|nr:type III-B CRISPR module RAMP protein Cmr6 [uncultured Azohydromonas sp.]